MNIISSNQTLLRIFNPTLVNDPISRHQNIHTNFKIDFFFFNSYKRANSKINDIPEKDFHVIEIKMRRKARFV